MFDIMNKSLEQRLVEVQSIYRQLNDLGLSNEHEGVATFKKIANDFVKDGTSASGSIPLRGLKRKIVYILTMRPQIVSSVTLKYDKDV
jgi:hypothetical protein